MIQIRRGVFETNSSSTHSITLCMVSDYDRWQKREVYLNENSGWSSNSVNKGKKFVTKDEAIDILTNSKYPPEKDLNTLDQDELDEYLRDEEFYTCDNYENDELEGYSETMVTPNGETVIAFGQYGHD